MRTNLLRFSVSVLLGLLCSGASVEAAEGRVQLELIGEAQGSSLAFQEWARVLGQAGIRDVRIRSSRASDEVGIVMRGTEAAPTYVVTGVIRGRDELVLPSGRYRRSDVARLARWVDELARLGPEDRREPKAAFGLTRAQFEQIQKEMSQPVGFSTAGMARDVFVRKLAAGLQLAMQADASAAEALSADQMTEELIAVSRGTAVACVLRPAGYCMVPREVGGRATYVIVRAQPGLKIWPVGWDPQKPRKDVLPALFEFHNVNVQGVDASTALKAIARLLEVDVLLDHNAMARHGVEPDKAVVSHPRARTTYSVALRKILFQAGLKFEVRVDEADRPFLWVTTVKPV